MTPCITWPGYITKSGYGTKSLYRKGRSPKNVLAHRWTWEQANGPIPDGLHVLHRCDVRSCVNLDHLYLGTNQDNVNDKMQRGRYKGNGFKDRTHCVHGHAFTRDNTHINGTTGQRVCRICATRWAREYRARQTN